MLIHYGSYETTFVRRMSEQHGGSQEGSASAKAIVSAINLVAAIFGRIYFPTCANGLKDIAGWFGFKWSGNSPSGTLDNLLASCVGELGGPQVKGEVDHLQLEDCQALQEIAGLVSQIYSGKDSLDHPPRSSLPMPRQKLGICWHRFSAFPISAFEAINKAAKWDYQRNKGCVRTDKGVRVVAAKRQSHPVRSGV